MPGQMHCKRTVSPVKCWVGRWKVKTWCLPPTEPLENGLLRGTELFYFDSPLEAFLVHVNGSRDSGSETAPSPIWALGAPMDTNTPPSGGR